ncbi:MAG TPA: SusC/RagA family TonB-linked outer membrane protein [Puia sp.]|jgi:TonB-linked SusC/RagA family outer membrane protein
MRKLLRLLWCAVALTWSLLALAQDQKISGTVKDPRDNSPLTGATVTNKRTKKTVQTDDNGQYSVAARAGDELIISHVGRKSRTVTIGTAVSYTTMMDLLDAGMDQVVVTAMDIKRNPRELGYSTQSVTGKAIQETQRENFVTALQGRVAGLTVTPTGGQAGASASIVLRGFNSLGGTNQPLFVMDGVILDNSTMNENSYGGTGVGLASDLPNRNNDYTNRIADLNPSDIESITVLKGPEATALYGSQASNGAIIITSRKAKATNGRVPITYDDNFRTQKITRWAAVDNTYGPGASNGVPTAPPISGQTTSFGPAWPSNTKLYDNLHHFFKTGFSQLHDLSAEWGKKNAGFRFSGSYFNDDGVIPFNNFKRITAKISNNTKIGKYVDINPTVQYVYSNNLKPLKGAAGYLEDLYVWPADHDVRNYQDKFGGKVPLFQSNVNTDYDNPIWGAKNNKSDDKTERIVATMGININPFSWLAIAGRFGFDTYEQDGYLFTHPESYLLPASSGGSLDNYYHRYNGYNHTITATASKQFGDFHTRVMVGTMWEDLETKAWGVTGSHLKDSTSTDSSNTLPSSRTRLLRNVNGLPNLNVLRELAYFGEVSIGWKDLVYLTYSHRFESASPLPAQNRNYNYPAASLSVIMSDLIPAMKGGVLDFWKLRGSLASTARLNDPYSNQSFFINNQATQYIPSFAYGYTNSNPYLQPERQRTYEIGTELRLFNNAVSMEAAYYNTYCYNQIAQGYRASYATGFILNTTNAASIRNEGIEYTLNITPIKKKDFNWDISFNFNHMWSKVLTLPNSIGILNDYYNSDTYFEGNVRAGLIRGHSTGTITGFNYKKNNAGQILVDPGSGVAIRDQNNYSIGDRTPTFTLGTLNTFRYKNWSLSFLWDLKVGGDIYNGTDYFLTQLGRSSRTHDRMKPIVVNGVLDDGYSNTAHPTKNNIVITPYYNSFYYTNLPDVEFVQHNVNWLQLRDVTLTYRMPDDFTRKFHGLKGLSFFATGNDLILITNYAGADPAVNGNNPGTRGVGSYGMDFGSPANPIGASLGLRANF